MKIARRIAGVAAIAAVALVAAGVAYAWVATQSYDEHVEVMEGAMPPERGTGSSGQSRPETDDGSTTVLIVGSDAGSDGSSQDEGLPDVPDQDRSDTIMIANITDEGTEVVSILRDLWVEIPGHGQHKVNAAYSFGGMPLLVETVESLTNVRIDHATAINLAGFEAVVDQLGTVTVDVPMAFTTRDGVEFDTGPQQMDAEAAESFVRERYAFADGDEQRVRNQQAFIAGVIDSVGVTDAHQATSLIESFGPHLSVDEGLDSMTAAQLAVQARPIEFTTIAHAGTGRERGQAVLYPDHQQLEEIATRWG